MKSQKDIQDRVYHLTDIYAKEKQRYDNLDNHTQNNIRGKVLLENLHILRGKILALKWVLKPFIIFLLLTSCSVQKGVVSNKPYICKDVCRLYNVTYHRFVTLSGNYERHLYLDTAICKSGDTLLIKDIKVSRFKTISYLSTNNYYNDSLQTH